MRGMKANGPLEFIIIINHTQCTLFLIKRRDIVSCNFFHVTTDELMCGTFACPKSVTFLTMSYSENVRRNVSHMRKSIQINGCTELLLLCTQLPPHHPCCLLYISSSVCEVFGCHYLHCRS